MVPTKTVDLAGINEKLRTPPQQIEGDIEFGKLVTPHRIDIDYKSGVWGTPRVVVDKEHPHCLPSTANVLHYGQAVFEGLKAFKHEDGELRTFRPDQNALRMNNSLDRLCMPTMSEELFTEAIHTLIDIDRDWFPQGEDSSLYIRPFCYGNGGSYRVSESPSYRLSITLSPSGPYFQGGVNPIKLLVTDLFHRAPQGGTGYAKAAGNYAGSLYVRRLAHKLGCDEVLYLSANQKGGVEEAGAMNHAHVEYDKDNEPCLYFPKQTDSILASITAQSIEELARMDRINVRTERQRIPWIDLQDSLEQGIATEAAGVGTAAVIVPIGTYVVLDDFDMSASIQEPQDMKRLLDSNLSDEYIQEITEEVSVQNNGLGPVLSKVRETYTGIQQGKIAAPDGWMPVVERQV